MPNSSLSDLTPIFFLQTFITELMHANEQQGAKHCEQLIEHIARTVGCFFEETYRGQTGKKQLLDKESYIELILGLKNNIGGNFSLSHSDKDSICVTNTSCPFGDSVQQFPELCRMTCSVFGGIAARNFGYAKVNIQNSIARRDGYCQVSIYTNPSTAQKHTGVEYTDNTPIQEKPDIEELHQRIEAMMQQMWRQHGVKKPKKNQPPAIVAKSPVMQKVLQSIEIIAPTLATVLIQGQTGVGKELIARAIHAMSQRSDKAFIPINCGAIPESLLESTLFGHEKGAFTGAIEVHQGYFERAEGGTLFLDEIDSLSPAAQTRLLRVIQEGELERVGGKQTIAVDVRIISATNQDLEKKVSENVFRHDLYYRINVVKLMIPTLNERPEDLPFLVELILNRLNKKYNKAVASVSQEVMQQIRHYSWPGNIRELENTLERSLLFTQGEIIKELDLDLSASESKLSNWKEIKAQAVNSVEEKFLKSCLQHYQGDIKKIAAVMEMSTRAVYGKLKKYELNISNYRL